MAVASTTTAQEWREKLQQASEGDYQTLQSVKDYIFEHLDPLHPIFK